MSHDTLRYEVRDHVAWITVNRPEKLNALNLKTKEELSAVLERCKTDPDVEVVIITGAGEKAFVAGTDIAELKEVDGKGGKEFALKGQEVFNKVENLGKPVIAAVNGYALGGGCELALACHIRIAADHAKFGQPEVGLGLIPGYGGTQRLARLIGKGRALELILTGDQIDAQEALRIGLVNRVVPRAELMQECEKVASKILSKGQTAIRMALKAVNMTHETNLTDGMALEASLFALCCDSPEFREGVSAFLEKRKPSFRSAK